MFFRFSGYVILIDLQMELPEDSIVLAKTHPPMYLIHKYWARKPFNVVKAYIEKYTKPGDIVLDPFCGSGVTIAESVLAKRNAIGIDINPFSIFLSQTTVSPVNIEELKKYLDAVLEHVQQHIDKFYGISCPYCNTSAMVTQLIWKNEQQDTQQPPVEKIQEIRIKCSYCNHKNHSINPQEFPSVYENENSRIKRIKSRFREIVKELNLIIPKIPLMYKNGVKYKQIRHYLIQEPNAEELFTKRNLLVLSLILSAINNIIAPTTQKKGLLEIRNLLLLTFTANLGQSSKMVWVISKRKSNVQKKKEVGSWTHHFYWNPREFFEINPLLGFKTRIGKSLRAQKNLHKRMNTENIASIHPFTTWKKFANSKKLHKICLMQSSSENIQIPDQSVDYIFTDPPYGDSIQYFELSTLWNKWLGYATSSQEDKEIVINTRQEKSKEYYFRNLENVFRECYRVLKNDSYMTVTFHNTDVLIRNGLVKSAQQCGFILDSLLLQMPARNSLKSYLHYEKSPIGDYYLRFKKSTIPPQQKENFSHQHLNDLIKKTIVGVLEERGEPTSISFIYNCIDEQLVKCGTFPLEDPVIVSETIDSMKKSKLILISSRHHMRLVHPQKNKNPPLTTRILNFLQTFGEIKNLSYSDIYNQIYEKYNGWNTPDRRVLSQMVDEIKKN